MKKILRDRVIYEGGIYWIEGDYVKVLMRKPFEKSKMPPMIDFDKDTVFSVEIVDDIEYDLHVNARIISY